jgi:hypothetical protein
MTADRSVSDQFAELFDGNHMAIGEERGGCTRFPNGQPWAIRIQQHLSGANGPVGVYPMTYWNPPGEWRVKWGCVDLDVRSDNKPSGDYDSEAEAHTAALNLRAVLAQLGVVGHIECTRTHGRHVWVFATDWVPARLMREALLAACQIADVSTREVNPKSDALAEDQLGNYVRLPYPGGRPSRRVFSDPLVSESTYGLELFVLVAMKGRATRNQLTALSDLYQPPPPPPPIQPLRPDQYRPLAERLSGLGHTMLKDGPISKDRSAFLFKFACECARSGLSISEAVVMIEDADVRWTQKFCNRRNPQGDYEQIARNAYAATGA